jgi:hypothetical protein
MDVNQLIELIKPFAKYKIGTDKVLETRGGKPKPKKCVPQELNEFDEPVELEEELEDVSVRNGYLVVTKWLYEQPQQICGHSAKIMWQRSEIGWRSYCQKCGKDRWAKLNKSATTLAQQVDLKIAIR